jgi:hypothetical protein
MRLGLLLATAALLGGLASISRAAPPVGIESPPPLPPYSTAPLAERLAAAKSVKVTTSILGLKLGSTLEQAHEKLDKLCDAAHRPKEEKEEESEEGEQKVLWELARTDYSFIFVKANEKGQITYLSGFLRPGKEIPFARVGEPNKAPVRNPTTIAWDVLRQNQPHFRVVASGKDAKASSIMIFVVKRASVQATPQGSAN